MHEHEHVFMHFRFFFHLSHEFCLLLITSLRHEHVLSRDKIFVDTDFVMLVAH